MIILKFGITLILSLSCLTLSASNIELKISKNTEVEEFQHLKQVYNRLSWYENQGYLVDLPQSQELKTLLFKRNTIPSKDILKAKRIFSGIYLANNYKLGLKIIFHFKNKLNLALRHIEKLNTYWGFKLFESYQVDLTLYGPGGHYNSQKGIITMLTRKDGTFKRKNPYETILHEIIHIGIQKNIVEKFNLNHWEKEALVDVICIKYLNEYLPDYKFQSKSDIRIKSFIKEVDIINNLPDAINRYVIKYPQRI